MILVTGIYKGLPNTRSRAICDPRCWENTRIVSMHTILTRTNTYLFYPCLTYRLSYVSKENNHQQQFWRRPQQLNQLPTATQTRYTRPGPTLPSAELVRESLESLVHLLQWLCMPKIAFLGLLKMPSILIYYACYPQHIQASRGFRSDAISTISMGLEASWSVRQAWKPQLNHISRYAAKRLLCTDTFRRDSVWPGRTLFCAWYVTNRGRSQPSRCPSIAFNETAREGTHLRTFTETKKARCKAV